MMKKRKSTQGKWGRPSGADADPAGPAKGGTGDRIKR
jgi:hypothetical protein